MPKALPPSVPRFARCVSCTAMHGLREEARAPVDVPFVDSLEEGFRLYPNVDLLDVCHSTCQHSASNEGFATAFSCNFSAEPGSHVRRRKHDAGAGHDANRPFTRPPCVG